MTTARPIGLGLATGAILVLLAGAALGAVRLTIPRASERATEFARHTCANDRHCVASGVRNCRRHSRRIVFCRTYLRRDTNVQGSYRCTRLIRLALDPKTHRVPVTGVGRWSC
jgi:hypothetical protein